MVEGTMDRIVVETSGLWRGVVGLISVLFLAAFLVNAIKMLRGQWTWDGRGIAIAVALAVVAAVALIGNAMVWTSRVVYDPGADTISVSMLGNTQTRSLGEGTRLLVRVPNESNGIGDKYVVKQPGQPAVSFYGSLNGDSSSLKRLVLAALERNPGLVDESDQKLLR